MGKERILEVRRILGGGDLDWDYILNHRSLYCITPLLFRNLKEIAGENAVPQSVMDNLAARYVLTFYQNMQIRDQLQEVLDRLNDEGIPVILLKGIALAQIVYSDIALRPIADIDLLAKKADLPVIAEVLLRLDYVPSLSIEPFKELHHMVPYRTSRAYLTPTRRRCTTKSWSRRIRKPQWRARKR